MTASWRVVREADDEEIVAMCVALNEEDPCEEPVPAEHTRRTLAMFRAEAGRGRAVVLEVGGDLAGYALLVPYWSNELGGEVCVVDEVYVRPAHRGRGHAAGLIEGLAAGSPLWPGQPVALQLEVSPDNERARRLYQRLGFSPVRNATLRRSL